MHQFKHVLRVWIPLHSEEIIVDRIISTIGNTGQVRLSEEITRYESFTRWLLGGRE